MEQYPMEGTAMSEVETIATPACAGCDAPIDLNNQRTRTPLCGDCYEYYKKFPIPKWILLFGGGILVLLLVSFIHLPKTLSTAAHFQKGKNAAEQHRFLTAERELAKVVAQEPDYLEAKARLVIAAFHNMDFLTVYNISQQLENKEIDRSLSAEADYTLNNVNAYFPGDSLRRLAAMRGVAVDSLATADLRSFAHGNPEDHYAQIALASRLIDERVFPEADTLLDKELMNDPNFYSALFLKTALKREELQFDSALTYCDRILKLNQESGYALSAKARVLLKAGRDAEAVMENSKALALDNKDGYAWATKALIDHYAGNTRERDALLAKLAEDSTNARQLHFIRDIISGKEKFRN